MIKFTVNNKASVKFLNHAVLVSLEYPCVIKYVGFVESNSEGIFIDGHVWTRLLLTFLQ